ncbi:hypothetical protein J2S54_006684 [Streptomyces sp. DSM 42143]|uniref:hypothetical protein n=1 Tax=Streptomyces TaxID=1883 RepID=UPI0027877E06|nr:hypothetical protein [Streptomyces sp. DSM 42143]MDQ0389864.1 hypothetical protein [Streptomyces sp. DSM 42143]
MSSLWPLAPSGATDWLLERCGDGITGFMPPAMPDAVWVLNAMYEHEQGPADVSYHEYHRARLTEGSAQPHVVAGIELDAVSVATGGGLGRAGHPGPGWRRLRWAELSHSHARAGPPAPARSTPARVRRFHHTTAPVAGDHWTALVPARIRPRRLSVCRVEPNTSAPPPGRRSSACPIPPCSSDTAIACSKPSTSTRKRNAAFVSLYDDRALADPITDWYDCVEHA